MKSSINLSLSLDLSWASSEPMRFSISTAKSMSLLFEALPFAIDPKAQRGLFHGVCIGRRTHGNQGGQAPLPESQHPPPFFYC